MLVQSIFVLIFAFVPEGNLNKCLLEFSLGGSFLSHGGRCSSGIAPTAIGQVGVAALLGSIAGREFPTRDRPSLRLQHSPLQS